MPPFAPTPEQIQKASEDLHYEWEQLVECRQLEHTFRVPGQPDKVFLHGREKQYFLIITGFAVHARNLLKFFHGSRTQDDIIVADYLYASVMWPPNVPGKDKEWRDKIIKRADKRAAHLTYTRIDKSLENVQWEIDEIFEYISFVWNYFILNASPELFIQ